MAMKDGTRYVTGGYTTTWKDDLFGSGSGTVTESIPQCGYNTISSFMSNIGDRFSPNAHQYVVTRAYPTVISETEFRVDPESGLSYNYSKAGTDYPNGAIPSFPANKAYNNVISSLGESIRGSIDLSIDGFQARQTLELAKHILSVRKVITKLAEMSFRDDSIRRRQTSAIARKRAYATYRNRKDRYRAVKRNDQVFQPLKDAGSYWLELQYGLLPTLSSIHALATGSADRGGNAMHIKNKDGRKDVTSQVVQDRVIRTNSKFNGLIGAFKSDAKLSTRYKIGGYYLPSKSHAESLSRLSSLNPVSIAWELLPFSFVVDWFYDIGSCLRGVETAMISNLGEFRGFQTVTTKLTYQETATTTGLSDNLVNTNHSRFSRLERVTLQRSPLAKVPFPAKPVFVADLGSSRLLNAAALLSQTLTSRKK